MKTMNKINIVLLAAVLLLAFVIPPGLAQGPIGPLLDNDLQLNTMQGVTGRVRVAFDGARYLAVWSEIGDPTNPSNDKPGIGGQFLTADGVKEGPVLKIYAHPSVPESNPDIAWNGSYYVVVWRNAVHIQALRVADDGTPSAFPFTISLVGVGYLNEDPAIASNGDDFFVTWQEVNGVNIVKGMQFAADTAGGPIYMSLMTLSTDGYTNVRPAVCYGNADANKFFVTWSRQETEGGDYDLYGAFITPVTAPGLSEPDSVFTVVDGDGDQGA